MKKTFSKNVILKDIRFWILVLALIRLYGITNPPLEVAHNWRQTTVTMVARNFFETDANILYPRIDIAGEKTGITGMEFPFYNYLIYLLSLIFGYNHWYGRLINLIVSSIGVYYFYKLTLKYLKSETAFYATIILLVSFWFSYSRKIMPDTFATSLVLISLYYGTNYLDRKSSFTNLFLYIFFGALGILSKLPVSYIWIIYAIWFFMPAIKTKPKIIFFFATFIIVIPVYYWYFIWVPFLVDKYGFWHFFMGKSLKLGFNETIAEFPRALNHFYETAIRYIGFILFLAGLATAFIRKQKLLLIGFLLSLLSFSIIIFKSGNTFAYHSYYVLPFIPVMSILAGYGLSQIKNKWIVTILLISIGIEGLLNQWNDFYIKPDEQALVSLEADFDKFSESDDLIVINSGYQPTPMYFAHRKGWVTSNSNLADSSYVADINGLGCKYALILKKTFGSNTNMNAEIILDNEYYKVYKLE